MNEQFKRELDVQQELWELIPDMANLDNAVLVDHMPAEPAIYRKRRDCHLSAERFVLSLLTPWRIADPPLTSESAHDQLEEREAGFADAGTVAEPEFAALYPAYVAATAREVAA